MDKNQPGIWKVHALPLSLAVNCCVRLALSFHVVSWLVQGIFKVFVISQCVCGSAMLSTGTLSEGLQTVVMYRSDLYTKMTT